MRSASVDQATRDQQAADSLRAGRHPDPFSFLGPHETPDGWVVRVFLPGADSVEIISRANNRSLAKLGSDGQGLFAGTINRPQPYLLRINWSGTIQETEDPYSFGPILTPADLQFARDGQHWRMAEPLGATLSSLEGVAGARFAVWAPNAKRVSVVGDFNSWDGRRHSMRLRYEAGIWEIFIPRLIGGERYKYEILDRDGLILPLKADPFARQTERPPATGSIVPRMRSFNWSDDAWMNARGDTQARNAPISIYEVHAGSWLRPGGEWLATPDWRFLAEHLIPYAVQIGFTHIELLPIMEHPFGGSWGYQPLSLFAPSARYGEPEDFAVFVDKCHRAGLGVILDWVPAHFPADTYGLARFDGTHLFEHADPREGFHPDWNTLIFNLGRSEVRGFLIASALYWLDTFHVDGLRVDAVASILYRDYSRKAGEWVPNIHGGRENLEAVDFLRKLNEVVHERASTAMTIAEESTAWPGVSAPVSEGGLGFSFKWNMGWMHDTLSYIQRDPVHRHWHHHEMTFGLVYAFSERFILPLSHDEVVHGKGSLYGRVPGDHETKLAALRTYLSFMWTHPGKKLLFMGGEFGQPAEWNHDGELAWSLLESKGHAGLQRLVIDLNALYRRAPALHRTDADPAGFQWLVGDDSTNSVFAYLRRDERNAPILCVVNMTPVARNDYRIGVPSRGRWSEILNTDSEQYGGGNRGNLGGCHAEASSLHQQPYAVTLQLPPLSTLIFSSGE